MPMKRLFAILMMSLLLAGCSQEEEILPDQQSKIVSFLTSTHSPKLVSREDLDNAGQVPYYSTMGNSVYRYIEGVWNPDRADLPQVEAGSTVRIVYSAYVFSYSAIGDTSVPYDSNDGELMEGLLRDGVIPVIPEAWNFEPLTVRIGEGGILNGLEMALVGCRLGDRVEVYMTYNMAYGDKNFSIIPKESPVACFFTVESVE